jgi:hypothetical protein
MLTGRFALVTTNELVAATRQTNPVAIPMVKRMRLLHNSAKHVDDEAIKKAVKRCSGKGERPYEPVGSDGLL